MTNTTDISTAAKHHVAGITDPDDARDMAMDYDHDRLAQYLRYVDMCAEDGTTPLPFEKES